MNTIQQHGVDATSRRLRRVRVTALSLLALIGAGVRAADAPVDPETGMQRAAEALNAQQPQQALDALNQICPRVPRDFRCFLLRAQAHFNLEHGPEGLADLDAALALQPSLHEARMARGGVRFMLGQRDGALSDLAALDGSVAPESPLRDPMGELYMSLQRWDEARRQWDQWVTHHANDPAMPRVLNNRCFAGAVTGIDLPLALKDCRRAVELQGDSPSYRDSLGWTLLRSGDAAGARASFDQALALDARHVWSLFGRGLALRELGQPALARADLAAAREVDKDIDKKIRETGLPVPEGLE